MEKLMKAISDGTSALGDEGSIGQLTLSSGLKLLKASNTSITCKLIVPNFLSDDNGNWHVGAIATLIDNIGAAAVFVFTAGHVKASLDFTISYFSTATIHEEVEIEAKIIGEYRGSLTYVLVEVKRASNGELIALGKQWMATGEETKMGERKVLNKYYPPDFDPAKLPRARKPKNQQMKIRMMLPMSIQCKTCGVYIYKGTKFNSRKEDVGETYLGIQIFRFYFKCTKCSSELAIKTDPQNSDYVVESGASRNYEPWRAKDEESDTAKRKRDSEELGDAMKALENRTLDSKREMDNLAALDEMKSMKSRHATVSLDDMLAALQNTSADEEKRLEEEDEILIKSIFSKPKEIIKRISDDEDSDDEDEEEYLFKSLVVFNYIDKFAFSHAKPKMNAPSIIIKAVKKPVASGSNNPAGPKEAKPEEQKKPDDTSSGLQSLFQSYDSDDDDD
ncbi:hypothetical protein ACFE04_008584 [Oxalis oulophora]